ncbi:hypothetical protein EHQ83_15545 [Leptospira yasudae]|uniref:Uncharacterized protein n=1 Tax=Leptospira yasudae TaxID=2202201 RepID=A0A6N4QVS2_9LEPT|nr:hypothetical protein EHQ72_16835 [Leptospira yasudae]TGL77858.1 hypothetical protein EHQ77_14770 [Leptospira yasudae]TGL81265.1 hypothetical protein EHQ83_15545 [Leptospira yasudae]
MKSSGSHSVSGTEVRFEKPEPTAGFSNRAVKPARIRNRSEAAKDRRISGFRKVWTELRPNSPFTKKSGRKTLGFRFEFFLNFSSKKRQLSLFSFSGLFPIQIAWNPKTSNQPGICKTGR